MSIHSGSTPHTFVPARWFSKFQRLPPPLPEPEESIPLRILVQLLVTVGIVATDLAAADSTGALGVSFWAVPVSAAGAAWSWRQRRKRNIPVKFCIAIAMVIALGVFFARLWGDRNDTRLALATLLIHLQVFHSFDLPRRKDLGYSVLIGLILLGVAATLSQTLTFAPLLLLFISTAIPVLVLDYRSRLGLPAPTFQRVGIDLAPRRLGPVMAGIIGLGLAVFLVLPRFPGYQLRSFPVSTPIPLQQQFNTSTISNPGYVREGSGGTGTGTGTLDDLNRGPGQVDKNFYYGFNSRINQNLRGEMQPRTVMRVRSQAPGFWRVLAFDRYTGQGWEISRNAEDQVRKFERPDWSFRFSLPWSVTLNRSREVIQTYTMVSDLPNLIPALYEPKELYFPTTQIAVDEEGGLRSPVLLSEGLTYTVVSEVPYRDRTRLNQTVSEAPNSIQRVYLQLPAAITNSVRQQTEMMLAKSPRPLITPYEKALYLAQYLKQNYRIQPDLPFFEDDEDLAMAFLTKFQGGYPDHFATTLTVMLRSIGIPARLVMGFSTGEFNPFTGFYVVQNIDAHAMTEVYFHKFGWFAFDPIPGHALLPPSIEESNAFGVLQQFWHWVAGWLPSPLTGFFSSLLEKIAGGLGWAFGWLTALFTQGWTGRLVGLGVLAGLGLGGWLSWSGWQHWREKRRLAKLPPMEAIYQQMLRILAEQGIQKQKSQTPWEYAERYRKQERSNHPEIFAADRTDDRIKAVSQISEAYVQWRYGGFVPDSEQLRHWLQQLQPPRTLTRRSRSKR
ncbi:MAG: DUF3488 and DUF4129 domain-containing transglutaminase family protein [Elainella sp. Prado103]|jgi:transglutaminase-like putative cysteine protease|nr:DUF3488 and DUF4129 domain-containing transglutaminase family protein [Elainella sp. Prado103]